MIVRFFFCGLLMLIIIFDVQAQLEKGSWMMNGALRQDNMTMINRSGQTRSNFVLSLAPEVAYMVTDHLMLGGKLKIEMIGNISQLDIPVAQHLLVRHYFKKTG